MEALTRGTPRCKQIGTEFFFGNACPAKYREQVVVLFTCESPLKFKLLFTFSFENIGAARATSGVIERNVWLSFACYIFMHLLKMAEIDCRIPNTRAFKNVV